MYHKYFFITCLFFFSFTSCKKESQDKITIEGLVLDDDTKKPIAGISISVDAIKSGSGMGIITGGKRNNVGQTVTDANGYYRLTLKVFKGAERIEYYLNAGYQTQEYVEHHRDVYLAQINMNGSNNIDFTLSPTALLEIKFRNANPVSSADFFYFNSYNYGIGIGRGTIKMENCGTVIPSQALTWTGMDVCGIATVETVAERYTHVFWSVKKNGVLKQFRDSIYVKRDLLNSFNLYY